MTANELDDLDKDNEDKQGGDSDGEGEEVHLHNITLVCWLINDDLSTDCFSKSTAEQIVMQHF